jgi:hypothetical protein
MRDELKLMIQRKKLMREGRDEEKADKILDLVEQRGGLTPDEMLILQVY